jgi:hypothetical protein
VDPLILLDQAEAQGKIPLAMARKVRRRMGYLAGAVARVEKASSLSYPPYYVEPVLPVAQAPAEYGQMGVLFARVVPTTAAGNLSILVQFTAALVAFGTKSTIEAVAAHEFTHYVDLVRRLSRTNVLSEERSATLYESSFADDERLVPARLLFAEKSLTGLVSRKFKGGLSDPALNKKVSDLWVGKSLPVRWVNPEENMIRLGIEQVSSAKFDPMVLARVQEIQRKLKP